MKLPDRGSGIDHFQGYTDAMHDARPRPWFSIRTLDAYEGPEPAFYDPKQFPWTTQVEQAWPVILKELHAWQASQGDGKPYFRGDMVSGGEWKTVPLMTWGLKYHQRLRHFPETMAALSGVEGLVSVAFNTLAPGTDIRPHFGDTNTATRAHLGLRVPGELPCLGLRVRGEETCWREGKILLFCDGFLHSAWNHTAQPRQILLLDVIRPEFLGRRRRICGTVLGALAVQALLGKLRALALPRSLLRYPVAVLSFFATFSAITLTPVYNALGHWRFRR